jgi:hypothetical protein
VSISQPLAALPSQSRHVPTQLWIAQAPLEQAATAFGKLQAAPQALQWLGLVLRLISQPFSPSSSQSSNPAEHDVTVQAPALQEPVPFWKLQALPQSPQFWTSVASVASQPSVTSASQLPKPAEHVIPHAPALQVGVPFVALQIAPHAPQWPASVSVLISQPSAYWALQSSKVPVHAVIAQVSTLQVTVALSAAQAFPHAPHADRLPVSVVSQPSPALALQLPKPPAQVIPQAPF